MSGTIIFDYYPSYEEFDITGKYRTESYNAFKRREDAQIYPYDIGHARHEWLMGWHKAQAN